jgi:hypothetical protein
MLLEDDEEGKQTFNLARKSDTLKAAARVKEKSEARGGVDIEMDMIQPGQSPARPGIRFYFRSTFGRPPSSGFFTPTPQGPSHTLIWWKHCA